MWRREGSSLFTHRERSELASIRQSLNDNLEPGIDRCVLRILSNFALTAENQLSMVRHPYLLPYLVEIVYRRDIMSSDTCFRQSLVSQSSYDDYHLDALRVIAHLSSKIQLDWWIPKPELKLRGSSFHQKKKQMNERDKKRKYLTSELFIDRLLGVIEHV